MIYFLVIDKEKNKVIGKFDSIDEANFFYENNDQISIVEFDDSFDYNNHGIDDLPF